MLFAPIVALGLIVPTPPPQLTAAHQFQRPQLTVVQQSSVLLSSDSDSLVFPPSSLTRAMLRTQMLNSNTRNPAPTHVLDLGPPRTRLRCSAMIQMTGRKRRLNTAMRPLNT